MKKKKEKLYLITPSRREYKLGFLSPCRNGIVLGTTEVEGVDTSHLTTTVKNGILSSHITPQKHQRDRRYFPPKSKEEMVEKVKSLAEDLEEGSFIYELSINQLSQDVLYITQKLLDWLDSLKGILYEKRITSKEIIHILNLKRLQKRTSSNDRGVKGVPSILLRIVQG